MQRRPLTMAADKAKRAKRQPASAADGYRQKSTLEPERTFYDGPPAWTELVVPALSLLTVIGIIPFVAMLLRQWWVRYRITSRRIAVRSGFRGRDEAEIVYRDVASVRHVRRFGGAAADYVLQLRDGSRMEMRAVPNFERTYAFIMERVSAEAQESSGYGRAATTADDDDTKQ